MISLIPWKYVSGGLLFLLILTGIALQFEKRHSTKLQAQVVSLATELNRISSDRDEQRIVTREKVKVVLQKRRQADVTAKKIEQQIPLIPPNPTCRTPGIVMEADV